MTLNKLISKFDLNDGELARCYDSLPYGYYKEEVYPMFSEILNKIGDGIRVLDIGAGSGHLAFEFYKQRPNSKTRFVLMDSSYMLLCIAKERLESLGFHVEIFHRNYNYSQWEKDLGKYDAIISNNSLFHLKTTLVAQFYDTLYGLLKTNALLLNQQAFNPNPLKKSFKAFYSILGFERFMSEEDKLRLTEIGDALADIEENERLKFSAEIEQLQAEGWQLDETPSYASLDLSTTQHLEFMRIAGFTSACIWRKMHFAVLAGLKGEPFLN